MSIDDGSDARAAERAAIRELRMHLVSEHAALLELTEQLRDCRDRPTLRAHAERLKRLRLAENAYHEVLSRFHKRYGPLDALDGGSGPAER